MLAAFALGTFMSRVLKDDHSGLMLALLSLSVAVLALLYMSRVYTTRLQDRIIRLEMRVRAASMLSPEQQQLLNTLGIKHVAALRFASDGELSMLVERASREQLKPTDIKRAVAAWVADHHRT